MAFHDEQTELHAASIVGPTAPSTLSLGYPLHVGVEWTDTAGGGQVQKLCVAVDDGGNGTWQTIGLGIARVPLGDSDAPGGILAWANPDAALIIVTLLTYRITTGASAGIEAQATAGVVPDGATSGDGINPNFGVGFPGLDTLTTATVYPLAPGEYLTISTSAGSAAGLAGYAYIHYHRA